MCDFWSGPIVEGMECNLFALFLVRLVPIHDICTPRCLTGHLDPPSESAADGVSVRVAPGVVACHRTYWSPTRLKVKRAIRMDSVEPLMEGVPTHDAACGIVRDFDFLMAHSNATLCMYRDKIIEQTGRMRRQPIFNILLLQGCNKLSEGWMIEVKNDGGEKGD